MTSPAAQKYIDSVSRAPFAGYDDSATVNVPNPLVDDRNRSFLQFLSSGKGKGSGSSGSNDGGDDGGMSPEEFAEQEAYFKDNKFAGVYTKDKKYDDGIGGWLEKKIDQAFAPRVKFNKLTQTYRVTNPGGAINYMLGPLAPFVAAGSYVSQKNLENIQEKTIAGKEGYGIGMLNNAILGMSPGLFGLGTVNSGAYPPTPRGISAARHLNNIHSALEAQASAVEKGVAIPDITTAYNVATYGDERGSDLGIDYIDGRTRGSVVTSLVPNPLGSQYGYVKAPVTSGGHSGLPKGFVTQGRSGLSGTAIYQSTLGTDFGDDYNTDPSTFTNNTTSMGTDFGDDYNQPSVNTSTYSANIGDSRYTAETDNDYGGGDDGGGQESGSSTSASDGIGDAGQGGPGGYGDSYDNIFKLGGRVGMRNGGEASTQMGFINKDPRTVSDRQGIADNRFTSVPQGSFVMNQPANERYKNDLDLVLGDAEKQVGPARNNGEMIDVALSDGERLIRPEVVNFIEKKYGGGFLDNINNTGKAEVQRRQAKYGDKIGAAVGGLQTDRGFVQQLIGPDSPTLTGPAPEGSAPLNLEPVSPDNDQFFGRRFGDIKKAIQNVEIKGFEKDPYIFTGIKKKGKASSAFGPMQITASTLRDIKDRSPLYRTLNQEAKEYIDLLIQQGDDKVNIEKYGSMYRNKKKIKTPTEIKKSFNKYGKGNIPQDLHEKYYETIANITLRQKLNDHNSLEKALASYGEGDSYARKVLRGLD